MKNLRLITGLVLLIISVYAKGQDRIITTQNDTIFCRIIYVSPARIAYVLNESSGEKGGFIPREQVKEYNQGSVLPETSHENTVASKKSAIVTESASAAQQPAIISESTTAAAVKRPVIIAESMPDAKHKIYNNQSETDNNPEPAPFLRWRIGIQGGGGLLLSSSGMDKTLQASGVPQTAADNYLKHFKSGMYFGADVHYMLTDFLGVGLDYSLFTSSAQLAYTLGLNTDYYIPGYSSYTVPSYYSMSEKDKIYVNYIGPSVLFQQRVGENRKFGFTEEISAGYAHFREESRQPDYQYLLTNTVGQTGYANPVAVFIPNGLQQGNTFGAGARLSFEYYLLPWLSVNANVGGSYAKFNKLKVSTAGTSGTYTLNINMSRIDYSIGVAFRF